MYMCCDAGMFPPFSAPLVDQYLNANGIILGKTNLGELQSGYATNPTSNGITTALNPYDPTRTASGTSLHSSSQQRLTKPTSAQIVSKEEEEEGCYKQPANKADHFCQSWQQCPNLYWNSICPRNSASSGS